MIASSPIADELRRFILTSIASVPHLEALLLLRSTAGQAWDVDAVARRLYIGERRAAALLDDLIDAGLVSAQRKGEGLAYLYGPRNGELARMIDALAAAYASNLVGITGLIHSQMDRHAQQFVEAFTWRKDV